MASHKKGQTLTSTHPFLHNEFAPLSLQNSEKFLLWKPPSLWLSCSGQVRQDPWHINCQMRTSGRGIPSAWEQAHGHSRFITDRHRWVVRAIAKVNCGHQKCLHHHVTLSCVCLLYQIWKSLGFYFSMHPIFFNFLSYHIDLVSPLEAFGCCWALFFFFLSFLKYSCFTEAWCSV